MYCLNVHNTEDLQSLKSSIDDYTLEVKKIVSPLSAYEIGLRISDVCSRELLANRGAELAKFKQFLIERNLFARHINGFPYGSFHDSVVKEGAYLPDWASDERVAYTNRLIEMLQFLLCEGETGSISTVPLGYKKSWNQKKTAIALKNISLVNDRLAEVERNTKKRIVLAIEPEPDCVFENSLEFVNLIKGASNVGVCFDTCHFAVVGEDLLEAYNRFKMNGIEVVRVQVSSALRIEKKSLAQKDALKKFFDKNYLHQTRQGTRRFDDLNAETLSCLDDSDDVVVHFHVPLFFEGDDVLSSTRDSISDSFLSAAHNDSIPFEIETYTYSVLPKTVMNDSTAHAIAKEEIWLAERLAQLKRA